jgi:hypothetical protein
MTTRTPGLSVNAVGPLEGSFLVLDSIRFRYSGRFPAILLISWFRENIVSVIPVVLAVLWVDSTPVVRVRSLVVPVLVDPQDQYRTHKTGIYCRLRPGPSRTFPPLQPWCDVIFHLFPRLENRIKKIDNCLVMRVLRIFRRHTTGSRVNRGERKRSFRSYARHVPRVYQCSW